MQVKAIKMDMRIVEIPVNTRVRLGYSKISGTFKGVILAGTAILLKIVQLRIFNPSTSSIHYR